MRIDTTKKSVYTYTITLTEEERYQLLDELRAHMYKKNSLMQEIWNMITEAD